MSVTIVSGLPRSGTSLMMQMLEAGGLQLLCDDERTADADNPRGYFEYAPVKRLRRDLSWLDSASGRVVKVVVPLLMDLPTDRDYRVVLMHRAPLEVLRSQNRMLDRLGAPSPELAEERLAEILASQWREAEAWCRRHAQWQCVHYAELLRDPRSQSEQIDAFLGPGLDVAAMASCVDPQLWRRRS